MKYPDGMNDQDKIRYLESLISSICDDYEEEQKAIRNLLEEFNFYGDEEKNVIELIELLMNEYKVYRKMLI